VQVRITGEDPLKDFQPCPGMLGEVTFPEEMDGVRVDTWVATGTEVSRCCKGWSCVTHLDAGSQDNTTTNHGGHFCSLQVSPYYDSLLGKLMVWAPTREAAIAKMQVGGCSSAASHARWLQGLLLSPVQCMRHGPCIMMAPAAAGCPGQDSAQGHAQQPGVPQGPR
jgi:hypothetical protein